jgi:hypothetical protein
MSTKDWYNNTLAHSPGVGAVFGLLSCSVLPWQVNVLAGCMLVVIGALAYREWNRLNVVSFLRQQSSSGRATVLVPLFGLIIAGYYLTWILGWWIRMQSLGIALTGIPFVLGGPLVSALTYRRAVRVFRT